MKFRAILGGGEYNNLVKEFGGLDMPAVGVGIGDTVLLEVLKDKKLIHLEHGLSWMRMMQ